MLKTLADVPENKLDRQCVAALILDLDVKVLITRHVYFEIVDHICVPYVVVLHADSDWNILCDGIHEIESLYLGMRHKLTVLVSVRDPAVLTLVRMQMPEV